MRVAVAGGSGTIGASIINALASSNKKHIPIILSRHNEKNHKNTSTASASPTGVTIETRYVDYTSHDSLVSALCDVNAVISALLIPGPEFVPYQINLLHAAEEAGCTRFAPSEFALRKSVHSEVDVDHAKLAVWDAVQESVDKGKIDAALFPCGMFMNYLGIGAPRSPEEALAGFREGPHLFHLSDPQGPWMEVPVGEDGLFPSLSMTDIRDVGRFVVAALEMEEPWGGRELSMTGGTIGFAELIELCERCLGMAVEVRQVTVSQLERRLQSVDPSDFLARMEIQYSIVCGRGGSVVTPTLNVLCPYVQPLSVKEFMERYWMV